MNRQDFRFAEPLRVRWAEVDLQRIVFNGHYLMYFDTAVAGWWRAMALPYEATMHDLGGDFFVRKSTLEFEGSARYDDQLEVGMRCARIGNSSMLLQGAVFRGGQRLVTGELVYVYADSATQRPLPVPAPLRELFLWHIMEELEHRTVAFDALHAVGGGYVYRMAIGAWARKHYLGYVQRFLACFMAHDADAFANVPAEVRRDRKVKMEALVARSKPYLLQALMPWYNPSKVQMPAEFEAIRAHYSGLAVSIA